MLFAPDMKGPNPTTASGGYEERKAAIRISNFHHQYPASPHQPNHSNNSTTDHVQSRTAAMAPPPSPAAAKPERHGGGSGHGSSIEVVRRPRGRPPGSKNKPKPPVVVTCDSLDQAEVMRPHVLEVPGSQDIAAALTAFCRRRNLGLSVLSATGSLSDLTLRQPDRSSPAACTFRGRFEILSIAGAVLPPSSATASGGFSVTVAGPQGRVLGGVVAGPMVAAGTVTVVAAGFSSPSFSRVPVEEEAPASEEYHRRHCGESGGHVKLMVESSVMLPVSSGHLLSDVIWSPSPTAMQHPPYY